MHFLLNRKPKNDFANFVDQLKVRKIKLKNAVQFLFFKSITNFVDQIRKKLFIKSEKIFVYQIINFYF